MEKKPVKSVQKPLGGVKKSSSFLSIKSSLNSKEESADENAGLDSSEKDKDDFKEQDVKSFWINYLENLKGKQPVLYNVLNTTACKVVNNQVIFFEFPSNSAYDEFETLRENIFQNLKKHLNNYSIEFDYKIKETSKTILLTSKDKFEKMVKINPLLEKLRNDFRLEI
ncbi:hypothetical protein O2K51_13705 [Apibacter raozihei]|uniref:hypothetical protein n=1 Tax=Apibacter raozihei TaxID=2500547 RepID=UPI000FE3C10D|nr:hypothetical protein [Apibacter raozihei]